MVLVGEDRLGGFDQVKFRVVDLSETWPLLSKRYRLALLVK